MTLISRNSPCPCGSGKKYKKCCLLSDEAQDNVQNQAVVPEEKSSWGLSGLARKVKGLLLNVSADDREKNKPLINQFTLLEAFQDRRQDLEDALVVMKDHANEFERLLENDDLFFENSNRLFSEKKFENLRFSADDVRRAFQKVGYPLPVMPDEKSCKIIEKAALFLASKQKRRELSLHLFLLLPEYVQAKRFSDAWILQFCADALMEQPRVTNPFLHSMFMFGFIEWSTQQDEQDQAFIKDLGIDPEKAERMGSQELASFIERALQDPQTINKMEHKLGNGSDLQEVAQAQYRANENMAYSFLRTKEASPILLPASEVLPWINFFEARLKNVLAEFNLTTLDKKLSEPLKKKLMAVLVDSCREMVRSVFTPERYKKYKTDLHTYRDDLHARNQKKPLMGVDSVLITLFPHPDDKAEENNFLCSLCYQSLMAANRSLIKSDEKQTGLNL